jgi:hypothetical protein
MPFRYTARTNPRRGRLTRREFLKLGLTGAAYAGLSGGCETESPPPPPYHSEEVFELTDGRTLYDDFDGNGNLQTYDDRSIAESGRLSSQLWDTSQGTDVVRDPASAGLLTVVNEEAEPGLSDHGSKKLFWVGARDGRYATREGASTIQKGRVYGIAEAVPVFGRGWVVRLSSEMTHLMGCLLAIPREIAFADFKSFGADIMVSSASTAGEFYAALDYHTTIPEQPPGKSWVSDIGLYKSRTGGLSLFAQCANVNEGGSVVFFGLGQAAFDIWYNVRQDILTHQEDPTLGENQLRIEYYVNGILKEAEIPQDSEILLNPERTGWGPNRLLVNYLLEEGGQGVVYYDNVKGVYRNRIT